MKTKLITPIIILLSLVIIPDANALEIIIEGNGDGSDSEVTIEVSGDTNINQTNDTQVNNDVEITAETGSNQIESDSGESQIITGDASDSVAINNEVNQSTVDADCCQTEDNNTTIIVAGNGSNSQNTVSATQTSTTSVDVDQTATVTNQTTHHLNTGHNTISNGNADATIITGDIKSQESTQTTANSTNINITCCQQDSSFIKIASNGKGSINQISYLSDSQILIQKNEQANIINQSIFDLFTGNNIAGDNNGQVYISTGDITITSQVINDPINDNHITIDCCGGDEGQDDDQDGDAQEPPPSLPPSITPPSIGGVTDNGNGDAGDGSSSDNGNGDSSVGNGGQILGLNGAILPATGSHLLYILIANILMFLMGSFLRLYSGRSPAYAYATV